MRDAEHFPVEREHVVVVVAGREAGIERVRRPGRQIEASQNTPAGSASAHVVDQRRAVGRPVRRFERFLRAVELEEPSGEHFKRFERAAQITGAVEMQLEARQFSLDSANQAQLKWLTTILREKLGNAEFEALSAKGRAMTMEQAIAYALEEQGN